MSKADRKFKRGIRFKNGSRIAVDTNNHAAMVARGVSPVPATPIEEDDDKLCVTQHIKQEQPVVVRRKPYAPLASLLLMAAAIGTGGYDTAKTKPEDTQ